jgi:hypothetical protein
MPGLLSHLLPPRTRPRIQGGRKCHCCCCCPGHKLLGFNVSVHYGGACPFPDLSFGMNRYANGTGPCSGLPTFNVCGYFWGCFPLPANVPIRPASITWIAINCIGHNITLTGGCPIQTCPWCDGTGVFYNLVVPCFPFHLTFPPGQGPGSSCCGSPTPDYTLNITGNYAY